MSGRGPDVRTTDMPGPRDADTTAVATDEGLILPLVAETARIETRAVETGRVRVGTRTETTEQVLRETLRSDALEVTRVAIDRTLAAGEAPPEIRTEGGITVIPVLEEILVVEKRLVLREELHVRTTISDEDVEVPVTLRRQRAVVERVSPEGHVTQQPPASEEAAS